MLISLSCVFVAGEEKCELDQGILMGFEVTPDCGFSWGVCCLLCLLLRLGVPMLGLRLKLGV
jgi:hypothetical protein